MGSGEDGAGVGVVDEFKPTLGFSVYPDLESIASRLKSVDPANQRSSGVADSKHPRHVQAIEAGADIERSAPVRGTYFDEDVAAADHIGSCRKGGDIPIFRRGRQTDRRG